MSELISSNKLGINIPDILLPEKNVSMSTWSVVACDQYTSEPEYWSGVENAVGNKSSTFNLTFPEIYLESGNSTEKIEKINSTMKKYIEENILVTHKSCMIYVERKTSNSNSRKGIVLAVDLEEYDYNVGSQTLIRATEGTVIDRLPPRIKIRENAALELPHVMLLIDDPDKTVIEPLEKKAADFEKIYDFDLMMDSGHIKGYKINDEHSIGKIADALLKLASPNKFREKYQVGKDKGVLLFAVGDGNHSLASAKGHWENIKCKLTKDELENHPARFALVEVVNIHDDGIKFEPIHRVVFNIDSKNLLESMKDFFGSSNCSYKNSQSVESIYEEFKNSDNTNEFHVIGYKTCEGFGTITIHNPMHNLEVGSLQSFLDNYLKDKKDAKIDYIHGEEVVTKLGSLAQNIGFYLPNMSKHDLFKTVILDGVLPRKTFSMGEASEKRFYLECRKIVKD